MTIEEDSSAVTEPKGLSLANILDDENLDVEDSGIQDQGGEGWDEESTEKETQEGFCVECEGSFGLTTILFFFLTT
jgi:hypothetical protein